MGDHMNGTARTMRIVLIALLFFGTALAYLDRQVLSLLKPTLVALFAWSDQDFAHLGSVFSLATAATILFAGWFVDRVGVRRSYALAVGLWSLAGMAHALATTVQQFVMVRVLLAITESVNGPAAVKAAAQYLPVSLRSIGLGFITAATSIGAIVAPLAIPPLALAFGWQSAFLITGLLGFVWIAAWWTGTRGLVPAVAPGPIAPRTSFGWGDILRDRRTWAVVGAKLIADWVFWFVLFWAPDLFNKVFHLSQAELGGPIALTYAMAAFGAVSAGFLFPLLLRAGCSMNKARKLGLLFFSLLIIPLPLALQVDSPWLGAVLIGLAMFAHNGFATNIFGFTADVVPLQRVGTVMALGSVASNLSGMTMIEFAGWCLTYGYGYWPMLAMASIAYLLAVAWIHVAVPVIRTQPESGEDANRVSASVVQPASIQPK